MPMYINLNEGNLIIKKIKGILVGYDNCSNGYIIYTNDGIVILARSVTFVENKIDNANTNENTSTNDLKSEIKNRSSRMKKTQFN